MNLETVSTVILIPAIILLIVSMFSLKRLTAKINGVRNVKDMAKVNFLKQSVKSSDILFEMFFPRKYPKEYPKDFREL